MWHTLTPDDIADSTLGKLVSAGGAPAVGSELRDLVAGDAAACAMHERRVHSVLVRHVLGWDASKQRSVPGGGLFGECMAWQLDAAAFVGARHGDVLTVACEVGV